MSTLKRAMSKLSIRSNSEKMKKDKAALVIKISSTFSIFLCDFMNFLETQKAKSHTIDPKLFEGVGVTLDTFDPNNQNHCQDNFFLPMDLAEFQQLKPDLSDEWARYYSKNYLDGWPVLEHPIYPEVDFHQAAVMCGAIKVAFSNIPYKNDENEAYHSLSDLTTWKQIDHSTAFETTGFDGNRAWLDQWKSQPQTVWAAKDKPHIMASIAHHYEHDDDLLFVSEIQMIVMLMIVRLVNSSIPGHDIVPVMIFSCTGDTHGRIIQAHMNVDSLVIRKTRFYDFRPRKDDRLDLFLRYMTGQLQGMTRILNRPEIKSSIAEESYTIEHLEASGDI